jgi:hypothetical protein
MAGEITLGQVTVRWRARPPAPSGAVRFDERLSVPWWWWLAALAVVALMVESVRLGHPEVPWEVPAVVLAGLLAVALVRLGRQRVTVSTAADGEVLLQVGSARLPGRFITGAEPVAAPDKQRLLGPELDPGAFVLHRPWIGPAVRVELADPTDPTPYWIFSVRHPEALVECLRTAGPR